MDHYGPRFKTRAVVWKRTLFCMTFLLAFVACKRTDKPSQPTTPKPQTMLENARESGVKKAVFEFSFKPATPYQLDQPATVQHLDVVT